LNPDDVYCQVRAVLDETNLKEVIAMKSIWSIVQLFSLRQLLIQHFEFTNEVHHYSHTGASTTEVQASRAMFKMSRFSQYGKLGHNGSWV